MNYDFDEKKLLDLFVDKESIFKPECEKPYRKDGCVYAVMTGNDISDKSKKDILDGKRSINTLREGVVMFNADRGWLERNDYFMSWFSSNEENPD